MVQIMINLNLSATDRNSLQLFKAETDCFGAAAASAALNGLLCEASSGNPDAISAVISFAAGSPDSDPAEQGLRAKAEQGLLELYANPSTSPHVRKEIAAQAHAFYKICQMNKEKTKTGAELQLKMPFKLLYLAGRHESSRFGPSRVLDEIAKVFRTALEAFAQDRDKNIFSSTRTVTFMEMRQSHSPQGAFKGQTVEMLDMNLPNQVVAKNVKEIGDELLSEAPGAPKAKAAFMMVDSVIDAHWVPAVFRREDDKVVGYVLDSSLPSGVWNHNAVKRTVEKSLGVGSTLHYEYVDMQGLNNTCGLMTTRFISWIDTKLLDDPNMDVLAGMKRYVAEWKGYTAEQQKAMMIVMRAENLGKLAELSNKPGFNLEDYI